MAWLPTPVGFPNSSAGKESTCNVGDPGLIPGLGRFPGEGIFLPGQRSLASRAGQTERLTPSVSLVNVVLGYSLNTVTHTHK